MSYSIDDRAALKAAIATGALEVEFGSGPDSRKVKYRTLAEMRSILAEIDAELSPTPAQSFRTSFISHSRD